MDSESVYRLELVYSSHNTESLRNKKIISDILAVNTLRGKIVVQEQEYEQNINHLHQYGIKGAPALLIFKNEIMIKRYFGETNPDDLLSDLENLK